MKPSIIILLILLFLASVQKVTGQNDSGAVQRTGFYLSMSLGPAFGTANGHDNSGKTASFSGPGGGMDIQIGSSISNNLFLHGTIIVKTITGPIVNGIKMSNAYSFDESIIGAGVTQYLENNFFITGNLGIGQFTLNENNISIKTNGGFAMQIKAGKEWWVSQRWALGASAQYSFISLTNRPVNTAVEKWNSERFSIMFNATMVKYRSDH